MATASGVIQSSAWIARAETEGMPVRFDVVTVLIGAVERVEYHRDVYAIGGRRPV